MTTSTRSLAAELRARKGRIWFVALVSVFAWEHAVTMFADLLDGGTFLEYVGVALALAMGTAVPLAAWNYTDKRPLDRR